ncbi:MAG TPA: TonB family protein [Bryobacteraceae bacterium]|nr:TonB family protein [Bryobacteraceae bacterium]
MPRLFLALYAGAATLLSQTAARNFMAEGEAAFRSGRFAQAVQLFEQAAAATPNDPAPRLYLAAAYVQQITPTQDTPETQLFARNAERELQAVLGIQPDNVHAMLSLATLHFNLAGGKTDLSEKARALDESAHWYRRMVRVQPDNKIAHYSLGVIAWAKFFPELMAGRNKLGMKPNDPGPLRNAEMKADLRSRFGGAVHEGMRHLERALEIDPKYDDAMAYLNLLHREIADLAESQAEYQQAIQKADELVQHALATKKAKAETAFKNGRGDVNFVPPPPPPPPPAARPTPPAGEPNSPKRIQVDGAVQASKLVEQPQVQYPDLAVRARIQGVVRFRAVVTTEGTVINLTLMSGHPVLVPAATEAVRRYRYQPTLLNGEPVEVDTQIEVNFTAP